MRGTSGRLQIRISEVLEIKTQKLARSSFNGGSCVCATISTFGDLWGAFKPLALFENRGLRQIPSRHKIKVI